VSHSSKSDIISVHNVLLDYLIPESEGLEIHSIVANEAYLSTENYGFVVEGRLAVKLEIQKINRNTKNIKDVGMQRIMTLTKIDNEG
jgi:hypothetical protein